VRHFTAEARVHRAERRSAERKKEVDKKEKVCENKNAFVALVKPLEFLRVCKSTLAGPFFCAWRRWE